MTNHNNENPEQDHLVLASGPGWEHRGRRNGPDVEIEIWKREERLLLPRTGLRYLVTATLLGTESNRERDEALLDLVARAILVLRDRDGIGVTPEHADERARNVVAALLGGYLVEPFQNRNSEAAGSR
jgi:hypothetical protein